MSTSVFEGRRTRHPPERSSAKLVVDCYDFFDCVMPECGLLDLTDGIYHGDSATSYEDAQQHQIQWLLDEVGCESGSRLLDIGCGNGTLVEAAASRGAEAIGITISPPQVARCRARGLDVRLLDYRNIGDRFNGYFDAIVANGSIEHFVQPSDLATNRGDAIYREMFAICHRILNPASHSRRLATTVIHRHQGSPNLVGNDIGKNPLAFGWRTPKFHYALLQKTFGGSYPAIGDLQRCAWPHFRLLNEVDGTKDYGRTSEEGFRQAWKASWRWPTGLRIWRRLLGHFFRHPRHAVEMFICLAVSQSWQWQFRGENPPMRLLRQTWTWQP